MGYSGLKKGWLEFVSGSVCCASVPVGGWGLCPWVGASCLPLCCASQCDVTQMGHWHGGHQSPSPPGGARRCCPSLGWVSTWEPPAQSPDKTSGFGCLMLRRLKGPDRPDYRCYIPETGILLLLLLSLRKTSSTCFCSTKILRQRMPNHSHLGRVRGVERICTYLFFIF